jgi:ActR/RegA family two-component response regulator
MTRRFASGWPARFERAVTDLVAMSPAARVLLATGNVTPAIVEEAARRGASAFIGKPYDTDRLLESLPNSNTTT